MVGQSKLMPGSGYASAERQHLKVRIETERIFII